MIFVIDRTEEDVLLGNEKGRYTAADLNRVESNVKELAELATQLDILLTLITKTDWGRADGWMDDTNARRYIGNVIALANACGIMSNLPTSMDTLDYNGANNIEKALKSVKQRIDAIIGTFRYSGEFYAGEEQTV